jgi:hypothetical protein
MSDMKNMRVIRSPRGTNRNRLEFRFFGIGGSATGPWEIAAFVLLEICAIGGLIYLLETIPLFASALAVWVRYRWP